jgi:chromosome segregation ATPase
LGKLIIGKYQGGKPMEKILHQVLEELKSLNTKVDGIDKKVDRLEVEQQALKTEQQSMKQELHSLKVEQQSIKQELHSLKVEQQSMKQELHSLKVEQQSMKDMLISQGDHIHQLIQVVGATNMKIKMLVEDVKQLKEDVSEIKAIQLDHQQVLNYLSYRSVLHEISINELRKAE